MSKNEKNLKKSRFKIFEGILKLNNPSPKTTTSSTEKKDVVLNNPENIIKINTNTQSQKEVSSGPEKPIVKKSKIEKMFPTFLRVWKTYKEKFHTRKKTDLSNKKSENNIPHLKNKAKGKDLKKRQIGFFHRFGGMGIKEQTHFAKRLSFLVKGGVPLLESLHLLKKQAKSISKQIMFDSVITDVSNGQFLSTSLAKFRKHFGDFAINIIHVGETSGILSQNLNYLAEELKKKQLLKQKVIAALVYPIFITVATLGITVLLTVYIFPKIMPIFTSLHVKLPVTTKILIFTSSFLINHGIALFITLLIISVTLVMVRARVEKFRYMLDWLLLKIPFVGKMAQNYNMANFTRTLGLLLKSGITVVHGISITSNTTTNRIYKKQLDLMADKVTCGERISKHMENNIYFPDLLAHMVSIGEETGNLPDTLMYLSEMYEHDLDEMTKGLSSSIEPILMVVMGTLVGFIAISVITPIYEITQNLNPKGR